MELRTFWRILIRRWWLVVAPVLVVLVHTILAYRSPPTVYQVVLRFAAGTPPAGLSQDYDRYYPWLTSEYIANGLADVAETGAFAQAVAARLAAGGLAVDPAAVQGAIITDNAQSILVVYLTWPDASQIHGLARAVAGELTQNSAYYFPQLEGLEPAIRQLDAANPVALPPGLRAQLLGPAVRLTVALVVGVALALAWHYLDPTVREAEELEAAGLHVLAQVPRSPRRESR
jgi:capsular polysaccharide biosynthesis protein